MKKIVYITGTRADYGLMRQTLFSIKENKDLDLSLIVTGMHLMSEFGKTITEIDKDGFKYKKIKAIFKNDDRKSMAVFLGKFLTGLIEELDRIKPDIILVLGDRAEMLAAAVAGTYLGIPVAHVHGGEVTSTVDEEVRHSITKLAKIHFPATEESAERIIKLGENKNNVYVVGAPGLDQINESLFTKEYIEIKYKLDLSKPFFIIIQHPVTGEIDESVNQMEKTMEAVKSFDVNKIIIYPNADAGGRKMIKVIEKYRNDPLVNIYDNIKHKEFLSLMKYSSVIIGNSSSGIIEAPSFKVPVVNIGPRQEGRQRGCNVIDVDYNKEEIEKAINFTLKDEEFGKKLKTCTNPYGDGNTGNRIAKILSEIKIDKSILQKKITY